MRKFVSAFIFSTLMLFSFPAFAAELLMVHNPACGYCQAFLEQVAPTYGSTKQGRALPLHVLDISKTKNRDWLRNQISEGNIKGILGTPTFIIFHNGKEQGRVVGYGGVEWFYSTLDKAIQDSVYE